MKKVLLIICAVVLFLAVVATSAYFYIVNSPEYALKGIMEDVTSAGMDGLTPHLTSEVQTKINSVTTVTDNKLVSALIKVIGKSDYIDALKTELQSVNWTLEEVLKNRNRAAVFLSFDYQGKITGTLEIHMTRENGEWKISGLNIPEFDKFELSSE